MTTSPLPAELIVKIIHIAARQSYPTAATLYHVSTWVRAEVEPILYRVLLLTSASPEACTRPLSDPKYIAHMQSFGFCRRPMRTASGSAVLRVLSAMEVKPRIRNFITTLRIFDHLSEVLPFLEELHLLYPLPAVSLSSFTQLRRIHVFVLDGHVLSPSVDLRQTGVTHIAFTIRIDERYAPAQFVNHVRTMLEVSPRSLNILLVRIQTDSGDPRAVVRQLKSIQDPRMMTILLRDTIMYPALSEWERNAKRGGNIWDDAEAQLASRAASSAVPQ